MPLFRTRPLAASAAALTLALAPHALAPQALAQTDPRTDVENVLDGDGNIAGTEEAIEKSEIPMEGAVADTMGEALALDKATDLYETGRPLVLLEQGYEKIDLEGGAFAGIGGAPVFGMDETPLGTMTGLERGTDGTIEGLVRIDGQGVGAARDMRMPTSRMALLRRPDGSDVRVYVDADTLTLDGTATGSVVAE